MMTCRSKKGTFDDNTRNISEDALQAHYRAGYLEALFGLVNAGKISLNDAAEYAGISYGETEEFLQGWKEAHDPEFLQNLRGE